MSDGFVYTEYGRYFEQEEEKRKASDKKFKILKILVIILSVVLILNVVFYAVVFPCFSPAHVVIKGLENIVLNQKEQADPFAVQALEELRKKEL